MLRVFHLLDVHVTCFLPYTHTPFNSVGFVLSSSNPCWLALEHPLDSVASGFEEHYFAEVFRELGHITPRAIRNVKAKRTTNDDCPNCASVELELI